MNEPRPLPAAVLATGIACFDVASLAALLGCSRHHVMHQLGKRQGFPAPLIDLSPRVRYWRASDVLHWLHQPGMRALALDDIGAPRLDTAGLADLLGCTRQHAADVIAKRADFPAPCIHISRRLRYWLYRDVLQWLTHGGMAPDGGTEPLPDQLDVAGIARLLGCTRAHAVRQVVARQGFPAPHINVSRRLRFWRTADVQAWRAQGGAA